MSNYESRFPCQICGIKPACYHHLVSRGAGGTDAEWNLFPTCLHHHNLFHSRGRTTMAKEYAPVLSWFKQYGWTLVGQKWHPPVENEQ